MDMDEGMRQIKRQWCVQGRGRGVGRGWDVHVVLQLSDDFLNALFLYCSIQVLSELTVCLGTPCV
jgi:hypothetical protein